MLCQCFLSFFKPQSQRLFKAVKAPPEMMRKNVSQNEEKEKDSSARKLVPAVKTLCVSDDNETSKEMTKKVYTGKGKTPTRQSKKRLVDGSGMFVHKKHDVAMRHVPSFMDPPEMLENEDQGVLKEKELKERIINKGSSKIEDAKQKMKELVVNKMGTTDKLMSECDSLIRSSYRRKIEALEQEVERLRESTEKMNNYIETIEEENRNLLIENKKLKAKEEASELINQLEEELDDVIG